jgi:HAD superfamily hydrolase (TIGR01459 family)
MVALCLQKRVTEMFEQSSLADLATHYDVFLIDQFGVLIDGTKAYPNANTALTKLQAAGKKNLLLSNSGKRSAPNEARLTKLGFDRSDYEMVLTSGEVAYLELACRMGASIQKGAPVFIISRDADHSCVEGLDVEVTQDAAGASLIIIAGSEAERFSLNHYEAVLAVPASINIPCWCINPDKLILTSQGKKFGSGQIASLYQKLGGSVEWFGKPYLPIYRNALAQLGIASLTATKVLCIGDSIEHDIVGGQAAGLKTALVRTGIHKDASLEDLKALSKKYGAVPDYIIPAFAF